jgi:hypothetical protein
MIRALALGFTLALTLCATAQAQSEAIVVTADYVGPRGQKFLAPNWKRLTPDGHAFVQAEAKRAYDGTADLSTIKDDAEDACAKAFDSCSGSDPTALAAMVLEKAVSSIWPDELQLLSGIPPGQSLHTTEQMQACAVRNDMKCTRKVFLKSLPADRRDPFERIIGRIDALKRELNGVLTSMGFDQKDDQ